MSLEVRNYNPWCFNLKKGDLFCAPERGKDLGGFPRLTALKVEGVTPDSHVYMSYRKMMVKVHVQYPIQFEFACSKD